MSSLSTRKSILNFGLESATDSVLTADGGTPRLSGRVLTDAIELDNAARVSSLDFVLRTRSNLAWSLFRRKRPI